MRLFFFLLLPLPGSWESASRNHTGAAGKYCNSSRHQPLICLIMCSFARASPRHPFSTLLERPLSNSLTHSLSLSFSPYLHPSFQAMLLLPQKLMLVVRVHSGWMSRMNCLLSTSSEGKVEGEKQKSHDHSLLCTQAHTLCGWNVTTSDQHQLWPHMLNKGEAQLTLSSFLSSLCLATHPSPSNQPNKAQSYPQGFHWWYWNTPNPLFILKLDDKIVKRTS